MQLFGAYNISIEASPETTKPFRVGLLHGRTGVPVFLIALRGVKKTDTIPLHSLDAVASQALKACCPEDRLAWEALFPFFDAGGSLAYALVCPLEGPLSATQLLGKDLGLKNRSGLQAVRGLTEVADLIAVPQAALLSGIELRAFHQGLFDFVALQESFFALLDLPKAFSLEEAEDYLKGCISPGCAVFYPWLLKEGRAFPSSPLAAASIQLTDSDKGIQEVPANRPLRGGYVPLVELGPLETKECLRLRLNTLVRWSSRELRLWGGATLADSLDLNARFISLRRTSMALKEAIHRVCEPFVLDPAAEDIAVVMESAVQNFLRSVRGIFNPDAKEPYESKVEVLRHQAEDVLSVDLKYSLAHAVDRLSVSVGIAT